MEMSSVEDACCGGTRKPPPAATLQRVGSGASDVIDPEVGVEAESGRKLPSSQYKGVVPQPNGRWGAQIYEKHQRVWLGTFNEEAEAARAYDVAVQRFRGRDAITNFRPLSEAGDDDDAAELAFLASRSKAEVVDMLRKHTYHDELMQRKRASGGEAKKSGDAASSSRGAAPEAPPAGGTQRQQHLFDKAVTPSDVGKLNRLVIPKQHAEKYFPLQKTGGADTKGLLLNFEDACGKVWRFRYSYWNSSQSYVLTKGWSRFVKEKGLMAGDVVTFRSSTGPEKQLFIDLKPLAGRGRGQTPATPVQVFRLFGVDIVKSIPPVAHNGADGEQGSAAVCCGTKKRKRNGMDLMASQETIKKQCVEAL